MTMTDTSTAGGTFPQSSTDLGSLIGTSGFPVSLPSPTEFFSQNGITNSTTQLSFLQTDANGAPVLDANGKEQLNLYAYEYLQLKAMPEEDRQQVQDALVTAGFLSSTDAKGVWNTATTSALDAAQSAATSQGQSDVVPYLVANSGPTATIEHQIVANASAAETADTAAEAPRVANLTDTNALNEGLSKAFEDALGYTPSAAQMNTFAQSFHGAQTNEVAGENEALRSAAQQEVTQATSEESALNKLGPNGLTAFVTAYGNALHGVNPAAGAGQQGPVTGAQAKDTSQYLTPGSKLPPDTTAGFNANGAEMVANVPPTIHTTTQQRPPGELAQLGHAATSALGLLNPFSGWSNSAASSDIQGLTGAGTPYTNQQVTTSTPGVGMATAPQLPVGATGTTPTYGGFYSLSTAMWQQVAKAGNVDLKKYPTAGSAPLPIQQGAFAKWAQDMSDSGESWSDIAITAAGGNPSNSSKMPVMGKAGTNLQSFANGIATQVNNQLQAIANQSMQPAVPVIGKEAPNAAADELAAAESSDPNQYIAHNMSLAEGTVQKMLYGTPQIEAQSTSNLAADVAQVSASNSAGT